MIWFVPALLTISLAATPDTNPLLSSPDRRVRSTDKRITDLLRVGVDRSPTFARLVEALNRTDVIVYIQPTRNLPRTLAGRLLLLPMANQQRYLRIQVRGDLPAAELIALIGHELRHALEIADEPTVRDEPAMLMLYQRIGHQTGGLVHTYDTDAAQTAGRQVRMELAG
jgi:hypothetical protein